MLDLILNYYLHSHVHLLQKYVLKFRQFLAVAAIDFGTTYSGCAFSTVQDFKADPLKITTIELDDENVVSYKTPTVLLLNPEGHFHSFGSKAADHYLTLAETEEAVKWYYFDRFKMQLYRKGVCLFRYIIKSSK